jgi:hypothetical protein
LLVRRAAVAREPESSCRLLLSELLEVRD